MARWYTLRQEKVRCGKPTCKTCPHGPYWYAYWHDSNGRLHKSYVGKTYVNLNVEAPADPGNWLDDIFSAERRSAKLAWEILGNPVDRDRASMIRHFRALCLEHHPDRGGDDWTFRRMSAAFDYLRDVFNW